MAINKHLLSNRVCFNLLVLKSFFNSRPPVLSDTSILARVCISLVVIFLTISPSNSMASGRYSMNMRSNLIFKAGELQLYGAVYIHTSAFETGKVLKSRDARIIRETLNLKYKVGRVFGVSMLNIRHKTKVKFKWYYPKILGRNGRNKVSVYSSPEYWVNRKHHIYWSMDYGEKAGKYRLDIYCNGRLAKRTTFHIRK